MKSKYVLGCAVLLLIAFVGCGGCALVMWKSYGATRPVADSFLDLVIEEDMKEIWKTIGPQWKQSTTKGEFDDLMGQLEDMTGQLKSYTFQNFKRTMKSGQPPLAIYLFEGKFDKDGTKQTGVITLTLAENMGAWSVIGYRVNLQLQSQPRAAGKAVETES